jgi:Domain of unknown function (DUF4253)
METFMTDYWPYVVGLALTLGIYFVMFTAIPFLFRKIMGTKPARQIRTSTIVTMIETVAKPKPVFPFEWKEVAGADAMTAYEAAKLHGKGVPVIIGGGAPMVQSLADAMSYLKPTPEQYIEKAGLNPAPYPAKSPPKVPKVWPRVGPFETERHPFSIHMFPVGVKPIVTIAYVPAQSSAEIPAYLKLGNWNAVPDADVFVALLRKWQRDYGAELVALTTDAIDVRVARRPATQQEAMKLAREHAKFCPSTEVTLAERAAELMQLDWWHFWWD